jgi:hypothetical protein
VKFWAWAFQIGLTLALLWSASAARAQTVSVDAPSPQPSLTSTKTATEVQPVATAPPEVQYEHRFWDRTNILLFSGVALVRGMDYASTRNFQARGRKEILLAPEVVNNDAAFASLEAAGTLTSVGISYIFHRTGHHTLERWMSISHIGVTAFGDVRNYCLVTRHR